MSKLPKFLAEKGITPPVEINPALEHLGTETAFAFGVEVADLERSGKFPRVYRFHIGDTGPTAPEPIIKTAVKAWLDKQTKYAPFLGFPQTRANIARHMSETRGVPIGPENIMLEPGCKPAIELSMQALVGPDDWVVGQNPGYPIYESLARFYTGGRYIPWLAQYCPGSAVLEFRISDLEKILASGRRVKLLIVNTPQNPTGMVMPEETIAAIAELAKKHRFFVLFDDVYDRIVFGGRRHVSLLSMPGMLDWCINLNGLSKDYAMTGVRIGFVIAPAWLIEIFGRLAINKWGCVSRVHQIVAGTVFGDMEVDGKLYPSVASDVEPIVRRDIEEYERKGRFLEEAVRLAEPYLVPNAAEGAFYLFPNARRLLELPYVRETLKIATDQDLKKWLLFEKGFAALGGSDFGEGGAGHIRLSYAEDRDRHIIPGARYLVETVMELVEKSGLTPPLRREEVAGRVAEIAKRVFG